MGAVSAVTLHELQLEVAKLKTQLAERDAAIADRDAKIAALTREVAMLRSHVERLLASRRGNDLVIAEGQGLLFPETSLPLGISTPAVADAAATTAAASTGTSTVPAPKERRKRICKINTLGLPREDRIHELPADQRICPQTGLPLVPVDEKVEEELDYVRGQLRVIRHRRVIYGLAPEQAQERKVTAVVAAMPPRPIENCIASATLLAWLLVQKYGNHLPLYRQEQIFGRDGLRLPRQTQCDWVLAAADALKPIADCLLQQIRNGPVMQIDDTPVMCQGGRGAPNFQAYLWTFVNPQVEGVVYRFTPGRASDSLAAEIGDFEGAIVGDGYRGNSAAANKVAGLIVLAGCWAHVIRKLRDAESEAPGTAKLLRDDARRIYAIEQEADERGLDRQARAALRQEKTKPVLVALMWRIKRVRRQFHDSGAMLKAINYIRNQINPLRRFLTDGLIPVDNNACERAIRPIAIGRRNWLFAGSLRGGRAAAVVYTLIECCRLAKVDMVDYFADVLARVATHPASRVQELIPANWAATRRAAHAKTAPPLVPA